MFQPATVGGVSPPSDPLAALQLYSSLGLRCFPATYLDKTPHPRVGKWGAFAALPPVPPERWASLVDDWDRFNVALICDEHLVVIDLDNLDFVAWFDAQGPERLGTWIVRSPSGGLHVYAYSDEPQRTTVIKATSGVKIGDVKARGGYVIAPPSVGSNGDYTTEYGSPDGIARQASALTWFLGYVQDWDKQQPVRLDARMNAPADGQPEYANTEIYSAPPPSRQEELLKGLRVAWMSHSLNRKVYDTLVGGVEAAEGYWKNPDDRSDVDFGCVKELINIGWGFPEIEEVWTFAPIGERYRSDARAHGHGYLLRTYDAAKRKWDAEQADLMFAAGPGWKVVGDVECWEESREIHYAFSLKSEATGKVYAIECGAGSFASPADFKRAVYKRSAFFDLGPFADSKGLRTLAVVLERLGVERPKPETATREGYIRFRIRQHISEQVMPRIVSEADDVRDWFGWTDGTHVYTPLGALQRKMQRAVTPSPTEPELWRQWLALGGEEARWKNLKCWRAPRSSFPELQLS